MNRFAKLAAIIVPVVLLGACTTLSDKDRALLQSASQNAADAKAMAQQALDASRSAQQSAAAAAADAKSATEKADRMFQKSLRK
jgi:hypothetical protein